MERRRILKLLAAAATGLWAKQIPTNVLLQAAELGSGAGNPSTPVAPISQESPSPEPLLPLFPLELVLFPRTPLALHIFEERYKEMIGDCLRNDWEFGILLVHDDSVVNIGCTASVTQVVRRYPDGRMDILVLGRRRFEIRTLNQEKSYLRGRPRFFEDDETEPPDSDMRQHGVQLYGRLMELLKSENQSAEKPSPAVDDPQLSFQMMDRLPASPEWKQNLLELRSEHERLTRVVGYLQHLVDYLEHSHEEPTQPGKA